MPTDYANLPTPEACYADFCLIPVRPFRAVHYPLPAAPLPAAHCLVLSPNPSRQVGTGSVSVAKEVAEVQKLLKASGLHYQMHSAGTTVEGSWDDVFRVVGQAHALVHAGGVVRVQSSMRVGTRCVFPCAFLFFGFLLPPHSYLHSLVS